MKKLAMIVLDGFGVSKQKKGNAIKLARTPFLDSCFKKYPHSILKTDGENVGLEKGVFGNSEVGHLNLGTGRVVLQDSKKISNSILNKSFFDNKILQNIFKNENVHLIGLLSDGKVHADISHLKAIIEMAKIQNVKNLFLHSITDGRDSSIHKAYEFISEIKDYTKKINYKINFATISGRYFAMDRENNLDRTQKYFETLTSDDISKQSIEEILLQNIKLNISDEYIEPVVLKNYKRIDEEDSVLFFNFRADRMRQLCAMFIEKMPKLTMVSFTEYSKKFHNIKVAFKPTEIKNSLSEVLSKYNFKQLRVAETTKYAHVTYFFNGEKERAFKNEKRIIIKGDITQDYSKNPKMKINEIIKTIKEQTNKEKYNFILVNFANCDMVGHTGNLEATIKAVEQVDIKLKELVNILVKKGYDIIITADHGNADFMTDKKGNKITTHSNSPAPFIFINNNQKIKLKKVGKLANVSPTILHYFGIKFPKEFTENSLLK